MTYNNFEEWWEYKMCKTDADVILTIEYDSSSFGKELFKELCKEAWDAATKTLDSKFFTITVSPPGLEGETVIIDNFVEEDLDNHKWVRNFDPPGAFTTAYAICIRCGVLSDDYKRGEPCKPRNNI